MNVLLFANVGTDQNGFYHIGDEAMFLEMVAFYRREFPDARLSALVSIALQRANIYERRGLPWPDTVPKSIRYFLATTVKTILWVKLGKSFFNEDQRAFIKFIQEQDLVHFTGGGNLTSECGHWFYYALLVAAIAKILGKPVILTSQTIGPFWNRIDRFIAMRVLNSVDYIAFRETDHKQELVWRAAGLRHPTLSHSLDAAYFLPAPSLASTSPYVRNRSTSTFRLGLSLHTRGGNLARLRELVNAAVEYLQSQHKHFEIIILPHILDRTSNWDIGSMQAITMDLPRTTKVILPNFFSSKFEKPELATFLKQLTGSCDLVLSTRYHGVIFSLAQAVPCLSITDGEYQTIKNLGGLRFIFADQAAAFNVDINQPLFRKKFIKSLKTIHQSSDAIRQKLQKKNKALKKENDMYLQKLTQEIRH